jgi:hyperosmotically inducible protein
MKLHKSSKIIAVALALGISLSWPIPSRAQSPESQAKPDNTKVNERDRNPGEATADRQKMNAADRKLTAEIRKSVMADKALSTYAHNVKIVSQNGTVTLKGPVRSDVEVKSIVAKAVEVVGSPEKVVNQMSVKP